MKKVLDVCCGSRMFWFDKCDDRVIFVDNRVDEYSVNDKYGKDGKREIVISPDVQSDFRNLPFVSEHFDLVVYDPPHLKTLGDMSWLALKYGKLSGDWRSLLRKGFFECYRVLSIGGTLIFKWNEYEISVQEVMKQFQGIKPLFGHKSGKNSKTHWIAFIKDNHENICIV